MILHQLFLNHVGLESVLTCQLQVGIRTVSKLGRLYAQGVALQFLVAGSGFALCNLGLRNQIQNDCADIRIEPFQLVFEFLGKLSYRIVIHFDLHVTALDISP